MLLDSTIAIDRPTRRRALRLAIVNVAFWSVGNSLTTGTLMTYFALALGASRTQLGWIGALAAAVGLIRFVTPFVITQLNGVKRTAVVTLTLSYLLMLAFPLVLTSGLIEPNHIITAYIVILCAHQLLENIGTVTLWAWIGDLVPLPVRGRFLGRRDAWKLLVVVPVIVAAGVFADRWRKEYADDPQQQLWGYGIPIAIGGACLLASALVLLRMPEVAVRDVAKLRPARLNLLQPILDRRFSRLLLFGCWCAFFNGISQSAQGSYPYSVLNLAALPLLLMRAGNSLGQSIVSPRFGILCDRLGNRPVMAVSQLIAATGMLLMMRANAEQPWWLAGAWVAFIAYAGVNLGLNNLMLKLAPPGQSAAYVANYLGLSAVAFAVGSIAGGYLFHMFGFQQFMIAGHRVTDYEYMFYIGWVTRSMGVFLLLGLDEPGARPWSALWSWLPGVAAAPEANIPQPHPLD